jgi:hypothetical protein
MVIDFRQNLLVGLDLTRAVGGAGFWFEAAWVSVDAFADCGNGRGDDYLRITTGLDYSFGGETYGFAEYHYNQAGSNDAGKYASSLSHTAYREGAVYLLGEHYLIPGISFQISPLLTGTMEAIVNLGDPSLSLTPHLEYNIAQDIYLACGAYVCIGGAPALDLTKEPPLHVRLESEFGAYPDIYYMSFRVYF